MVTAREIMNKDVYFIREKEKVRDLLKLFEEKKVSGVPVVDDNNMLVGIITVGDVLSKIHKPLPILDAVTYIAVFNTEAIVSGEIYDILEKPVQELMTKKVITVTVDTDFTDVAQILSRHKFKKVPVIEGRKLIGVVSRGEMVRYFIREYLQKGIATTSRQA